MKVKILKKLIEMCNDEDNITGIEDSKIYVERFVEVATSVEFITLDENILKKGKTMWKYIKLAKDGKKFKTRCGFEVRIYQASQDNVCAGIHGAILIPDHPATFGGWAINEWRGDTGTSLDNNETRDLIEV